MKLPKKVTREKMAEMQSFVGRRVFFADTIVQFKSFTFEYRKNKRGKTEYFLTEYDATGWSHKNRWFFKFDPFDLYRTFFYFDPHVLMQDYLNIVEQISKLNEREI